jgi:hypothetical protein
MIVDLIVDRATAVSALATRGIVLADYGVMR